MTDISEYTIYCTPAQVEKALALGAKIRTCGYYYKQQFGCNTVSDTDLHIIPTAEQMIGFIESISTIQIHIEKQMLESGTQYRIWVREECKPFSNIIKMFSYPTRKEASIAAIDAALEHIEQKSKVN